jgi:hypothetical protein
MAKTEIVSDFELEERQRQAHMMADGWRKSDFDRADTKIMETIMAHCLDDAGLLAAVALELAIKYSSELQILLHKLQNRKVLR